MAAFIPRAVFPTLDSLPRSYYLGHHAAGLAKMRALLNQIDFIIECRDYRIPLTSRNPMFEESLADRERVIVYTKKDLGDGVAKTIRQLRDFHRPSPVLFSDFRTEKDVRHVLDFIKQRNAASNNLTGSHCMVVGMPNVGKSSLLNALRHTGVRKGKVAITGAQPGVTRKIGTGVKIIDGSAEGRSDVYLLDTPGVFMPYVPDAAAMLKLALCGSVKDNIIPPFTIADYLLYHINRQEPELYREYHPPTNEIAQLLNAMARKIGRLQKGGEPDLDGTAMWMIQRWRNGHLGRFLLDEVTEEAFARYRTGQDTRQSSISQARKADKQAIRERTKSRNAASAG